MKMETWFQVEELPHVHTRTWRRHSTKYDYIEDAQKTVAYLKKWWDGRESSPVEFRVLKLTQEVVS